MCLYYKEKRNEGKSILNCGKSDASRKNKVTQFEVWIKGARDLFILKFPLSEIWSPVTKKSQYSLMIIVHHQDGNLDGSDWKIIWKFFGIQICSVNASTEQGALFYLTQVNFE